MINKIKRIAGITDPILSYIADLSAVIFLLIKILEWVYENIRNLPAYVALILALIISVLLKSAIKNYKSLVQNFTTSVEKAKFEINKPTLNSKDKIDFKKVIPTQRIFKSYNNATLELASKELSKDVVLNSCYIVFSRDYDDMGNNIFNNYFSYSYASNKKKLGITYSFYLEEGPKPSRDTLSHSKFLTERSYITETAFWREAVIEILDTKEHLFIGKKFRLSINNYESEVYFSLTIEEGINESFSFYLQNCVLYEEKITESSIIKSFQ